MGQKIEIVGTAVVGDVAVLDTDRSLSGQDGERYRSHEAAQAGLTYPAALAKSIFEADDRVKSVYVISNVVSVERDGGWNEDALEQAASVVGDFFLFYVPSAQ